MSRDQRFYWTEPFAFARARARASRGGNPLLLFVICALLMSIALLAVALPGSVRDLAGLLAISFGAAFLIAYPGMWLFSRLPNSVLVASDRIAVGRTVIPMSEVQSAVVGTTTFEQTQYPIVAFRTTAGQNYLFGLGRKINAHALADFLQRRGVREPKA
jgi:hypothetical protein